MYIADQTNKLVEEQNLIQVDGVKSGREMHEITWAEVMKNDIVSREVKEYDFGQNKMMKRIAVWLMRIHNVNSNLIWIKA